MGWKGVVVVDDIIGLPGGDASGGSTRCWVVPAGLPERRLNMKNTSAAMAASPTIPPTTPPAIGPALDLLELETVGLGDGLVVVLEDVLLEELEELEDDVVVVVLDGPPAEDSGELKLASAISGSNWSADTTSRYAQ
jgi:hypothetical protein